jgi:tetratricopeptide (TPR) repeat protein
MLANACFRQQRWTNSITHYVEAATLRPDHPDTFLCLGFALYQENRWADAIEAWRIALWHSPNDALPQLALSLGLLRLGLVHEADEQIARAMSDPAWRYRLKIDIRFTPAMIDTLSAAADRIERQRREAAAAQPPDQ